MTLIIAALVAVSPIPSELGPAWAVFSQAPALRHTTTKVEVGTLGYDKGRGQLDFWLRRTVSKPLGAGEDVTWADTRSCAGARPLLASIRDIPVPKFAPIGSSGGAPVTVDGISYSLRTYSDEGHLTAETNIGTPLANWVEGALKTLSGCWTDRIPERAR